LAFNNPKKAMASNPTKFRRILIAGNWKSNKFINEGQAFVSALQMSFPHDGSRGVEVWIAPPLTALAVLAHMPQAGRRIHWSAQQCSAFEQGAYTGECSAAMVLDAGGEAVIIGHSERRSLFGESDDRVADKVHRALDAGLQVIFCCGESLEERQAGVHVERVLEQLKSGLFKAEQHHWEQVVVAYEPIWAIGTGLTATPAQAQEMHRALRTGLVDVWGEKAAEWIPILYGGSLNTGNADELLRQQDVDGGLIGGASLQPDTFSTIVRVADQVALERMGMNP
jgi:triosephosphate isomerase